MKLLKVMPVLLLFLLCIPVHSQSVVIDSLLAKLKLERKDSVKAVLLNQIASEYSASDARKVAVYAQKALEVSQKADLRVQEAEAWLNLGNADILQSKYPAAIRCFTNSQSIYEKLAKTSKDPSVKDGLAMAYGSIGVVCSEQNNYPMALEYFFKALKLYNGSGRDDIAFRIYNGIGVIYESQKEYGKALQYYGRALRLQQKINDDTAAITLTNIGNIYLAIGKENEALQSFGKAEHILKGYDHKRGLGELYNSFGNYYRKQDKPFVAKAYYSKALKIFNDTDDLFGAAASLEYLGRIAETEWQVAQAISYYKQSAENARITGTPGQLKDSEKALSELYEKQGDVKQAFEHFKIYSAAHDSIVNSENIKSLVREEMNFEFERKEAERKLETEKKQALYKEQTKRYRLQMLFAVIFLLLLIGVAFLIYSRRQIRKNLTLQRDLAEYEQKALHLQMNPHFVFNCLGAISGFIVNNGTDSAIKYLAKFSKLMRLTLEYSKEPLIPVDKEIESLRNYLELEQLRFNQVFTYSITKDAAIEDDMAMPPLLIQPFVENAIIHGIVPKKHRGSVSVEFKLVNEQLICTVNDDGIGINKSQKLKENLVVVHTSMALEITRKRLEVIRAFTNKETNVTINEPTDDTGAVSGTKITISLPIQYLSDSK